MLRSSIMVTSANTIAFPRSHGRSRPPAGECDRDYRVAILLLHSAAKAATTTIPILFSAWAKTRSSSVWSRSLARPGGNATGINFLVQEITAKRLGLLRELIPKAARPGCRAG